MGGCFLSTVVSIMVLMGHNTKGTRQGNIKHAPKTNIACIVFFTLGFLVFLTGNLANLGSI
jgi:hypothetical protein